MQTPQPRLSRNIPHELLSASFEFFPPKTENMNQRLWDTIQKLAPLKPSFVSVTYGAGGSTRERTHNTVARILKETDLTPAAHLTCVGAARSEINDIVKDYWEAGVRHLVALRGDPLTGIGTPYKPHPEGFGYAADLVSAIKRIANFEVSVSGYPEKHPESSNWQHEIDNLKRKVDAGADRIVTQYFFDNDIFDDFLDRIAAAGINIPVVPGILPIQNFEQTVAFSEKCGTSIPDWLSRRFAGLQDDPDTRKLVGTAITYEQVMNLIDRGITDFHFYTMNQADLTFAICHMLGMRQNEPKKAAA